MAVLTQEEYFETLNRLIGDSATDENIKCVEDLTDTYMDMSGRDGSARVQELENQLEEQRKAFNKRYMDRFFSAPVSAAQVNPDEQRLRSEEERGENITVEDLFS